MTTADSSDVGTGCPTSAELTAFGLGKLSEADHDAVTRHLAGCPRCLQSLAVLDDSADRVLRRLRRPPWFDPFDDEPECGQMEAAAEAAGPSLARPSPELTNGAEDREGMAARQLGPYVLMEQLGRGGMGVVYKARHRELNRLVALKVLRAAAEATPRELARFRAEARKLAGLHHPHIVQIHEIGEEAGRPYFVMELVEGGSLAQLLAQGPVSPQRAAELVQTLARAVHHAHQRGIIHRDLKPANVLLSFRREPPASAASALLGGSRLNEPMPKISDFGLAKALGQDGNSTESGTALGTPAYMAPEQAAGNPRAVTAAADVYGLGAILYELLTGRPPFTGSGSLDIMRRVLSDEPVPPRRLAPEVPRNLEAICLTCLRKEPERRYASALHLALDLERFRAGEPIQARPVGPMGRLGRWCRRNPIIAGLLAAVAVSLVTGTVLSTYFALRAREAADVADARAAEARANLYVAHLNLAQTAWEQRNWLRLTQLLERYREPPSGQPDPRGWEWHFLWGLCHADLCETLHGHTDWVRSVAFSPDGTRLASASKDQTVMIWDLARSRTLHTLRGHTAGVYRLAFSPDGRLLASAGSDKTVRLWDVATGQERRTLAGHTGAVRGLAFSPDGRRLATAGEDGTARLWDVAGGQEVGTLKSHTDWVNAVAFSPDGRALATGSEDRTVKLWDLASGQEMRTLGGHTGHVSGVAFSPDGRLLASASWDGVARLWDVASGVSLHTLHGHTSSIRDLAFSPDGRRLVTGGGGDNTARVWDVASGRELRVLRGHGHVVHGVAFSPDGTRLASASEDHTIKLWDVTDGPTPLTLIGHRENLSSAAFSPDGQRLASSAWDGTVRLWDVAGGGELLSWRADPDTVNSVAFSPDGRHLASGGWDRTVRLWDAANGQEVQTLRGHSGEVRSVAFSPDGRRLASGSTDRTIKLWDPDRGQELRTLQSHAEGISSVTFSPDGRRLASSSWDKTVKVWDAESGEELHNLQGHTEAVLRVAFSPDGRRIASGGWDRTVRLWDAERGQELHTLKGHTDVVRGVAFSPDGRRLASSSEDGTTKVWDMATGQELLTLRGHPFGREDVQFSPDGQWLVCVGERTGTLWDGRRLTPEVQVEREALRLVSSWLAQPLGRQEVLQRLRGNAGIRDAVRRHAVLLAKRYRDGPQFDAASWAVARRDDETPERYQQAVAWAQAACQSNPDNGRYLTTLGVAQYRAGEYAAAVATLTRAAPPNASPAVSRDPTPLAFLALAHHRLGQDAAAQACLDRLPQAGSLPQRGEWWLHDEDVQEFLRQARLLIRQARGETLPGQTLGDGPSP